MSSLKKNVAYNIILQVTNILFPFITAPYVSRILGAENIGVFSFASTYASYFMLFAFLGIPTYGMRAIAKCENKTDRDKVFAELFSIVVVSTIFISLLYVASIYLVPTLYEQRIYLLIMGVSLFLAPLNISWYFQGRQKFKLIAVRSIIVKVFIVASLFIFVHDRDDLINYLFLSVGSIVLTDLWNWGYLFKEEKCKISFKGLNLRTHIKPTLLLFASTVAISIYTMLDSLMLGFLSSYSEVGYYSSALKVSKMALPLVTASSAVVLVKVASLKEQNDLPEIKRVLQNSFVYMYTFAVPITIGLIVIAPKFVPFFFGDEFLQAILPMQILSALILVIGLNNLFGIQTVQAMGHDKSFLMAILFGTFTNVVLNLALIPSYGAVGASLASVIAEIAVTIAMFYVSTKFIKLSYPAKTVIYPILASMPIVVFDRFINQIELTNFAHLAVLIPSSIIAFLLIMCFVAKNEIMLNMIKGIAQKINLSKK